MEPHISDSQLLEFNKQGLIPGPHEHTSAFLHRVTTCLHFSNHIEDFLGDGKEQVPYKMTDMIPMQQRETSIQKTKELYDCAPEWVPAFYSDDHLSFWHGGTAWIPHSGSELPATFFQLRNSFRTSEYYLNYYHRDEILAHESSHVGRMAFDEPIFEEIFAYQTSPSKMRRFLGPLVRSPNEALTFALLVGLLIVLDYALIFSGAFAWYSRLFMLKLIPLLMVLFASVRVWRLRTVFDGALENLTKLLEDRSKARAVLYRLTDAEITRFSRVEPRMILQYVHEEKGKSLRWRLLAAAYFFS